MWAVLPDLLIQFGPWLIFLLAILETCFITGLVVPSGTVAAFAVAFDDQTGMTVVPTAIALTAGGFLGDLIGYLIGRSAGESLREGEGWVAVTLRRYESTGGRLLSRHPVYAVTVARLVSFVRTIMPLNAGMTGIPPLKFIALEIPGLLAWVALYLSMGVLAGASLALVSSLVGAGWMVLFAAVGGYFWIRTRRANRNPEDLV